MTTVRVNASRCYDVVIASDILDDAGAIIKTSKVFSGKKAAVVTDTKVYELYASRVERSLTDSGLEVYTNVIKSGESSKNAENYILLLNFLAKNGLDRSDIVIALGGGVAGDLAGFAAATYMRGIAFVQIPTTLLAAVDSSVGGKTAIDLDAGKNLAGAFYQPGLVLCDYKTLDTLSPEVFSDGCAEIIKYGMITDKTLLDMLKKPIRPQLESIIARCVSIKGDIVGADERDTGQRKLLNFGHTIGHALEALSGYKLSHGSAVSAGMMTITRACVKKGFCAAEVLDELKSHVNRFGLESKTRFKAEAVLNAALADKKRTGDSIDLIVPEALGKCVVRKTSLEEMKEMIELGSGGNGGQHGDHY